MYGHELRHYRGWTRNFVWWLRQYRGEYCTFLRERRPRKPFIWRLARTLKLTLHKHFNPRDYYRDIKCFWQRGCRGYADRDIWSLDGYIALVLSRSLIALRDTKHGIPSILEDLNGKLLFDLVPQAEGDAPVPSGVATTMKEAERIWNEKLTDIAKAFQDYYEIYDLIMQYPEERWDEMHAEEQRRRERVESWAFPLLAKYFECLWD